MWCVVRNYRHSLPCVFRSLWDFEEILDIYTYGPQIVNYALKAIVADSVGVEQAASVVIGATSIRLNVLSKCMCDLHAHRNSTYRSDPQCTVVVGQCRIRDMSVKAVRRGSMCVSLLAMPWRDRWRTRWTECIAWTTWVACVCVGSVSVDIVTNMPKLYTDFGGGASFMTSCSCGQTSCQGTSHCASVTVTTPWRRRYLLDPHRRQTERLPEYHVKMGRFSS